ncbi:MAG: DUF2335 domain-containing protein [Rickettsiaceae bacterium]|nr:DUF2335 domain-containing protein [Rickettsiaceae bacterium]
MKTYKKFFEHDSLNKGYAKTDNVSNSGSNNIKQKYRHILPPIDMVEQYEELYPGTFKQLINMSEQEQKHRHSIERLQIEKANKLLYIGKIFSLFFIIAICITTVVLSLVGDFIEVAIFAVAAFLTVIVVSSLNYSINKKNNYSDRGNNAIRSNNNVEMKNKRNRRK